MTKKHVLAGAIITFLLASQPAQAPEQKLLPPNPIEKVSELSLEKQIKKSELEFLKLWYKNFPYTREIPDIIRQASLFGLEPELLMAIRLQENGVDSLAYGVMHGGRLKKIYENDKGYMYNGKFYSYKDEKEKQLHWAAQTVKFYLNQFEKNPRNEDFISFLGNRYTPIWDPSDKKGLNKYWIPNVKKYYRIFKKN